jgi:hypothetical protein
LIDGLHIVMHHNVFKFDNQHFVQLSGTAMGTPPAPPYATLYFSIHEQTILPKYKTLLRYYTRYIDDAFLLWDTSAPHSETLFNNLKKEFDEFGKLRWDFSALSKTAVFLDTRISLTNTGLKTTLYEKSLNLYLYIPPASMHSPHILRSIIFGHVNRLRNLCSEDSDRFASLKNLFSRLVHRGYSPAVNKGSNNSTNAEPTKRMLLLHKMDIRSSSNYLLRPIFEKTIMKPSNEPPLTSLENTLGYRLEPCRLIIANHRLRNLREMLSPRKFTSTSS